MGCSIILASLGLKPTVLVTFSLLDDEVSDFSVINKLTLSGSRSSGVFQSLPTVS
jgi:hypothetical protein